MHSSAPKSILVVQTAFIGDVLLVIPLLKAIKRSWPEAELDVVVRPPAHNLLETLPYLRDIIVYDKHGEHQGLGGFFRVLGRLRSRSYDVAFLPHRSLRTGLLTLAVGVPVRIGFNRGGGRFLHTRRVTYDRQVHEIQRNLTLLTVLGKSLLPAAPEVLSTEEDVRVVDSKLSALGTLKIVALAPGSVWMTKRWPEVHYIALGKLFLSESYRVVLIGGREDKSLNARIAAELGDKCHDLSGELTLRQSVEALRRCLILITNDSAPTHLGVAAGTRVLTLFGSTVPDFGFAPFGPMGRSLQVDLYCRPCTDHGRQFCPEEHFRCLKDLNPERVFAAANEMLQSLS